MGQVLHGSATTTEAVRRAIQHSQESLRAQAKRYGIKGVADLQLHHGSGPKLSFRSLLQQTGDRGRIL